MIHYSCPTCRNLLESKDDEAGRRVACPTCGQRMDVPRPGKPTVLADRDDDLGNRRRRYGDDDDRPRRNSDEDDNYVVRRRRKRGRTCECPNCGYEGVPYTRKEMAPEGLILLIVMLFVFFPLFFLGLLMKQEYELCEECGFKIRKVGGVTFG